MAIANAGVAANDQEALAAPGETMFDWYLRVVCAPCTVGPMRKWLDALQDPRLRMSVNEVAHTYGCQSGSRDRTMLALGGATPTQPPLPLFTCSLVNELRRYIRTMLHPSWANHLNTLPAAAFLPLFHLWCLNFHSGYIEGWRP